MLFLYALYGLYVNLISQVGLVLQPLEGSDLKDETNRLL